MPSRFLTSYRRLCARVVPTARHTSVVVARLALFATTVAGSASANPSARLVYSRAQGATSCPDEAALREAVARRFGYDPFFPWAERTVMVQIQREPGRFVAHLQILDKDGVTQGTRQLSSGQEECGEIFDATALAVSIALDAVAKSEPASAPESSPEVEPVSEVRTVESEARPAPPATQTPAAVRDRAPPPPPPRPFFAGADGLLSFGTAPSTAAGGSVFVGLRLPSFSSALEMRLDAPASTTLRAGSITSWLYAGSLVPCAHYRFGSLCAVGMLGSLQGTGEARMSMSRSTLFAAVGGRVGLEWGFTEALAFRAHADLLRNLAPTTLTIDSSEWTASSITFFTGAGLFVRFP